MLDIRWRPSGGRGEYEYKVSTHNLLHKRIVVRIPLLQATIETDTSFEFIDGKSRLRRAARNDRSKLNVPPLVAAICALPEPRREDFGAVSFPLASKTYVIDSIRCEVISELADRVVVEPRLVRPRHAEYIDIEERINELLEAEASEAPVRAHLDALRAGSNDARLLRTLSAAAHEALPFVPGGAEAFAPAADEPDDIIAEYSGKEGKLLIRQHRIRERDRKLVAKAKKYFKGVHGKLFCECCGIDFWEFYGEIGQDFIEAHHSLPLSKLDENTPTKIRDLTMLCSNCHRMVHRTSACSIEEIRTALKKSKSFIREGLIYACRERINESKEMNFGAQAGFFGSTNGLLGRSLIYC